MSFQCMRMLFLMIGLLVTTGVSASVVSVPMKLDYSFLHRMLLAQIYTDTGDTARVFDDQSDCSTLVLSNPQIGSDGERIRIVTAVKAKVGHGIASQCWRISKWQGLVEAFLVPTIKPEQPVIEFRVTDSNLLDREGAKPLVTGTLWDWVKQHVHSRLGALKIDLAAPLQEIQALIPLMLTPSEGTATHRVLSSAMFTGFEIVDTGINLALQLDIPDQATPAAAVSPVSSPEPALTSEEALRWEVAWRNWDAFLTFIIKQAAEDTEQAELRQALFEVLVDGRYDLTDALINWQGGTADPVRELFLKSWERLSPILQRLEITLPGAIAIRYLSFVAAADALKAMDQVSEKVGYEISADGLRRMARMLAPELEKDPLIYSLDVDLELRLLFGFGTPLPLPEPLPDPDTDSGTWFFFRPAWAADAPKRSLVKKLNRWVPHTSEIDTYLPLVEDLLSHVVRTTLRTKRLSHEYHDFFRYLSLATAWQESCWRQFIKKGDQIQPIVSRAGAIGIMQINPNVWRGFYEVSALRNDIRYNALAGNEILHHYLIDYVLAKTQHNDENGFDQLARLTYVTYNGGPGYFQRYRKQTASQAIHRVAVTFGKKYQEMKANGSAAVASCYG